MTLDSLEVLKNEIRELEKQISELRNRRSVRKKSLRELEEAEGIKHSAESEDDEPGHQHSSVKWVNYNPSEAVDRLLNLEQSLAPRDIIQRLMDGGAGINKQRGQYNIKSAISKGVILGRYIYEGVDLKKKDKDHIDIALDENKGRIRRNPNYARVKPLTPLED